MFDPADLLRTWCNGLRAHQVATGPEAGGIFCPAHGFVHGRCGDAVYPLLAQFSRSGEEKYRQAARAVFAWSERRASQPDGSWRNEADGRNDWVGITCFSLIALGESLRHHGAALSEAEQESWRNRLRRGADFLVGFMTFEVGDINYPFSSAAALALVSTLLEEPRYLARARELAAFSMQHLTSGGLIWGEGARRPDDVSPRGWRAIDVPYNVEESIPNLALYAELAGDAQAHTFAVKSLRAHLAWMLPDGGWDAGWCSRLAKWVYWGSRTSDGCAGGLALLQGEDPRFADAARRNLQLMATYTHEGLLHPGRRLRERELPICTHPTFAHARGLATALDAGLSPGEVARTQPDDHAPAVRTWPDCGVTQVNFEPWRASITLNDFPATAKRGGHPSGGALTMLWHPRTGSLCVASMNEYVRYEASNMDEAARTIDRTLLTPRLEVWRDGQLFSNLWETGATLESTASAAAVEITVRGHLRNAAGDSLPGLSQFELRSVFTREDFRIAARVNLPDAQLVLPIVADRDDEIIRVSALDGSATPVTADDPRGFNFVPGMEATVWKIALPAGSLGGLSVRIAGA